MNQVSAAILGGLLLVGLFLLGERVGGSLIALKGMERTVSVKGLSEREVAANIAIWPIQYARPANDLTTLYADLEKDRQLILGFLKKEGFVDSEITIGAPMVVDKLSNEYGGDARAPYRYVASQTISIYTSKVDQARAGTVKIVDELGKQGINFRINEYNAKVEYLYTNLNAIKPQMIEEATMSARSAAQKFAEDSKSKLGKIRSANQGQFVIADRDKNTPYMKTVRIVSTIEYYLSD